MSRADKLRIKDYLGHILEAIERINRYIGSMDKDDFRVFRVRLERLKL